VAIVTDNTFNDVCSFEVTNLDGSLSHRECAPGTVIKVERVSAETAAARNVIGMVVDLTGIAATDEAAIEVAVAAVHHGYAVQGETLSLFKVGGVSKMAARQSCPARNDYLISGTYGVGGGVQVNYNLRYDVLATCQITDIIDRARETADGAYWINSCSNGNSNCYARQFSLSTTFSSYYSVPSANYNNEYRNRSYGPSCCTTYYGFWTYTNP
jgi:hypothetical protein